MTDAPELKPCPFCGGSADTDHDHTVEENHAYGCRNCSVWFDTFNSDDAISAWNTRADLASPRVKSLDAADEATVEIMAIAMWREEALRAGTPNIAARRTTEEWREGQSQDLRDVWIGYARAALSALEGGEA